MTLGAQTVSQPTQATNAAAPPSDLGAIVARAVELRDRLPAKSVWPLVGFLRSTGRLGEASSMLDAMEGRDGVSIRLLEERARVAFQMGDTGEALVLLRDRAERSPSATAQIAIARLLLETGCRDEAAAISGPLLAERPDLLTVVNLAADVARAVGDVEAARSLHLELADQRPDHPGALLSLAKLSLEEGDRDAAGEFFRRAISLAEKPAAAFLSGAAAMADLLGKNAQALAMRRELAEIEAVRAEEFAAAMRTAVAEAQGAAPVRATPIVATARPATRDTAVAAGPTPRDRESKRVVRASLETVPSQVAAKEATAERVTEALRSLFGFAALRPGQDAVIEHVLGNIDTVAVMPTGAGKSLTFQLPAMLLPGTTIVISPLIALMKDQVESLPEAVRRRTALINSTLSADEMRTRLDELSAGELKLVYVAPERLRQHSFLRALRTADISLIVIDEAHCISMWGHDFRPDYLFIPRALEELGRPPVLAMTATATPGMVAQIGRALGRDLQLVRTSVFRPNLTYEVRQVENREAKLAEIVRVCKAERGVGIVYVSSRKDTEIIASMLRGRGVEAAPYHAGLDPETRARNQEQFMSGRTRVIVATVAFGMGIDKADVRFIVHVSPPKSLEAYAQESGRAGRDGEPARCILLVGPTDQSTLNKLNRRDEISIESLRGVYSMFRRAAHGSWVILDQATLRPSYDEDAADPRVALGLLEQAGLLRRHPDAPADYSVRSQRRLAAAAPVDGNGPAAAVERWLAARLGTAGSASFATTDACAELDVSPVALDRALADIEWAVVREGSRGVCLQLLTPDGDAGSTMIRLLEQSRLDAEARVRSVMGYAKGRQCRHAMIAAHFGEAIEPCGDRCDVCLDAVAPVGAAVDAKRSGSTLGADDALAVLTGLRTLPFPVGKAGLVRLLMGSEESRIRADRSVSFGVFAKTPKTKVEALVERLVEDGFIVRDVDHEYRLLSLSGKGQQAAVDDLAAYASQSPRSSAPGNAPHGTIDDDSPQGRLLADLTAWRRRQASEESVPAYVVAYNIMLENLAATRPATKAALLAVPGMGPVRVEKYGEQLLRIIAESQA